MLQTSNLAVILFPALFIFGIHKVSCIKFNGGYRSMTLTCNCKGPIRLYPTLLGRDAWKHKVMDAKKMHKASTQVNV